MHSFKKYIPPEIVEMAMRFRERGYDLWVVGGAIRNFDLDVQITDWDLATQATPQEILGICPGANKSGIDFGCLLISLSCGTVQVTTLRKDGFYKDHRRPHQVTFTLDLQEDLARRDFTCNAVAYHILDEAWTDPFGGRKDTGNRYIRSVGDPEKRLEEDVLRIFRGFRLMSQYGFEMDQDLLQAAKRKKEHIGFLSRERIWQEWSKIILGEYAGMTLHLMDKTIGGNFLPFHMNKPQNASKLPKVLWMRCAALWHSQDHTDLASDTVKKMVNFGCKKSDAKKIGHFFACLNHGHVLDADEKLSWLKLFLSVSEKKAFLSLIQYMELGQVGGFLSRFYQVLPDFDLHRLPVSTSEILALTGLKPGKKLGQLLRQLHMWIMDHPEKVSREAIENWIKTRYIKGDD